MENMYIAFDSSNNNEKETPLYEYGGNERIYIKYTKNTYIVNTEDFCKILNKRLFRLRDNDIYPSFCENCKKIDYLHYIYDIPLQEKNQLQVTFKNGNSFDLTRENVKYKTSHLQLIQSTYPNTFLTEYSKGHVKRTGMDAGIVKNPIWKITENDKEILLMYCEKDTICKLCPVSYAKILEFEQNNNNGEKCTWYKTENGYLTTRLSITGKMYSIHQVITGYYGHGKGTGGKNTETMSVDHIDRDPLNNTMENLRIATRKEQENNSRGIMEDTKRKRQSNARDLPDGITQEMLPKYVVYYFEKHTNRDYFRIERHPKLTKYWETTKSREVSIHEKLRQAIEVIENLKNDIYPQTFSEKRELPKYVRIYVRNGKEELTYDERIDGCIFNYRRTLKPDYNIERELILFNIDIHTKYPEKQLQGIPLELPNELVEKVEDPFMQLLDGYKQQIKFIKYVKICKDKTYYNLAYDEKINEPNKIHFNVKISLNPAKQNEYHLNDLLKELKKRLEIKYRETYPDKVFDIPEIV
jgi:hypothetical protein